MMKTKLHERRPQGSPPIHPTAPASTMKRPPSPQSCRDRGKGGEDVGALCLSSWQDPPSLRVPVGTRFIASASEEQRMIIACIIALSIAIVSLRSEEHTSELQSQSNL